MPDPGKLWPEVRAGLERVGILSPGDELPVVHPIFIPCAYVVFNRHRREVLPGLLEGLRGCGVISVGRYGAWEYSSMEKALLDGIAVAEELRS